MKCADKICYQKFPRKQLLPYFSRPLSHWVNKLIETLGVFMTSVLLFFSRVLSHDTSSQQAIIESDEGSQLNVNTKMIEPFAFTPGSCYNFIGEIIKMNESVVLQVRIASCIDTLDISLFDRTLELRRDYLNEKVA